MRRPALHRAPRGGRFPTFLLSLPGLRRSLVPTYSRINHYTDVHGCSTISNQTLADSLLATESTISRQISKLTKLGALLAFHCTAGQRRVRNKGSARWVLTHGPMFAEGFRKVLRDGAGTVLPWCTPDVEKNPASIAHQTWLFLAIQEKIWPGSSEEAMAYMTRVGVPAPIEWPLSSPDFANELYVHFEGLGALPVIRQRDICEKTTSSFSSDTQHFSHTGEVENADRKGLGSEEPNHKKTLTLSDEPKGNQSFSSLPDQAPAAPEGDRSVAAPVVKADRSRLGRLLSCSPEAPEIVAVLERFWGPVAKWPSLEHRRLRRLIEAGRMTLQLAELFARVRVSGPEEEVGHLTHRGMLESEEAFTRAVSNIAFEWYARNGKCYAEYLEGLRMTLADMQALQLFNTPLLFTRSAWDFRDPSRALTKAGAYELTKLVVGHGSSAQRLSYQGEDYNTVKAYVAVPARAAEFHRHVSRDPMLWRALMLLSRQVSKDIFAELTGSLSTNWLEAQAMGVACEMIDGLADLWADSGWIVDLIDPSYLSGAGGLPRAGAITGLQVTRLLQICQFVPLTYQLSAPVIPPERQREVNELNEFIASVGFHNAVQTA